MSRRSQISHSLPLIIGHRGASASAPENTLAAFEQALRGGADGIEFDVRLARDGVPVVIHDPTLKRTALLDGTVESFSSEELRSLDAGTWFNLRNPSLARSQFTRERVPTLAQVFERFGAQARVLYVELKCDRPDLRPTLARAAVELIYEHGLTDRAVVKSFAHDAVGEVKRLAPEVRTAALFERSWSRPLPRAAGIIAAARACRADEISLHHTLLRRATVESARAAGLDVITWTVDSPLLLRRALALGLRAVITNRPALLRAALEKISAHASATNERR